MPLTGPAAAAAGPARVVLLKPARVFDGDAMHEGWAVRVRGDRIDAGGPAAGVAAPAAEVVDLPGTTLLPGLIEGHSHVLLHPYNETPWNDQVLKESLGLRMARAVNHLRADADGRLHDDPRPRHRGRRLRRRRAEAGGRAGHHSRPAHARHHARHRRHRQLRPEGLRARVARAAGRRGSRRRRRSIRVVRDQIGHGADWIKVYADYRWGARGEAAPTFSLEETARRSSRPRAAAAARSPRTRAPPEGMRRAMLAGVETIEHGDGGTPEVFKLMAEHNVALCPTLAAGDATSPVRRLEEGRGPGARGHHPQARELQGGARRRRHDPQRQRRRRLHATATTRASSS